MKRVKAACILQTLIFCQKDDSPLPKQEQLNQNWQEVASYKKELDAKHTRYQIDEECEQPDGSVLLRIRKQYNAQNDVGDYFN